MNNYANNNDLTKKGDTMAVNKRSLANLINTSTLPKDKLKKQTSKAGKRSVEVKRARKTLKEELLLLLSAVDDDGKTNQEHISLALIKQAIKGDVNAFKTIEATIGEKPIDKVEVVKGTGETIEDIDNYLGGVDVNGKTKKGD